MSAQRYVVGSFDDWLHVREALRDARSRGLVLAKFYCVALERVFAGKTIPGPMKDVLPFRGLPFSDSVETICCTDGPLADCLMDRLNTGARNLKGALGPWLIPRRATQFESMVVSGKILLWLRVADDGGERDAYRIFFAHSSDLVGVRDLES
jgi:hypothetical protein